MGALFGLVGTSEIAQARRFAALDVDGELLHVVVELPAALEEEPVVVVELLVRKEVDVVLFDVLQRPPVEVLVLETRDIPALDHLFGHGQRCAGVDDCRPAVGAAVGQGHGAVFGEGAAGVEVELAGHIHLASGELLLAKLGAPLEDRNADALATKGSKLLGRRTATRAGADDHDVVLELTHGGPPCRRISARSRRTRWSPVDRSSP